MHRPGFFPWLHARFFGERTAKLAEELQRTHWLSYLLVVTQSTAVVLVLGHAEIPLLFTGSWPMRTVVGMALAILVATVYAADTALLATLRRVPILARNRATFALWEHVLFVLFVLLVEGSTYAVVMSVLDRDPAALLSPAPLIPQTGALFFAQVVLRAVLICWSTVQLFVVRARLPPQLSTLLATGKEIVGGHVEQLLATLDLRGASLADSFRLYVAMSKTPRRARTWWNGALVRAEVHQEAEEERQTELVLSALETFEQNRATLTSLEGVRVRTPSTLAIEPPSRPPTGPGSPAVQRPAHLDRANGLNAHPAGAGAILALPTVRTVPDEPPTPAARPAAHRAKAKRGKRANTAPHITRAERSAAIRERRESLVAEWLAEDPQVSTRELVRRLRNAEHNRSISESTASELRHVVEARQEGQEAHTAPDAGSLAQ